MLAFPLTYMNESGQAVRALMKRHGVDDPSKLTEGDELIVAGASFTRFNTLVFLLTGNVVIEWENDAAVTMKTEDPLGWVSGIGFYIDNVTGMYNTEHRMTGEGFLAPYAHVLVSLLDLDSMRVVKSKHGFQTTMALPQDKKPANHSWDAMSPQEKVDALEYVIKKAVATGMSGILAP